MPLADKVKTWGQENCLRAASPAAHVGKVYRLTGPRSQDFFDFIQGDPSLLAGLPTLARVAAWEGGLPIKVDGEVVGAIGVSGASAVQNDVDCAKAALALLPCAAPAD